MPTAGPPIVPEAPSPDRSASSRLAPTAARLALPLALVAVAIAWAGSLRQGFVADARFLIADNRYLEGWRYLLPTLTHDYFWSSSGAGIPYWRPLTKLSWLVEAQLFGRSAPAFHAVQLGWLLMAVAAVYTLARRLGASATWSGAAAIAFGLHPALAEPGCLLMARSDVVVTACLLWSLVAWRGWVTGEGRAARRWAMLHVAATVLALASKETAVVLPAALTVWALVERPAPERRRRQLLTLAPGWLLAALYLIVRARVLGPGARGPEVALDPLRVFVGLGVSAWGLVPFRITTGVRNLSSAEAHDAGTLALSAAVWLGIVALSAVAVRRRAATAAGLLTLGAVSLLPVLLGPTPHVPNVAGKVALADRWLMIAAAAVTVGLVLAAAHLPGRGRRLAAGLVALWLVGAAVVAPAAHAYYASEESLLELEEQQYEDTPDRFRTVEDRCRARDRMTARAVARGDADEVLRLVREAPAACPVEAGARFNLASVLVQRGRYTEARPLLEALLADFHLDRRYHAPLLYFAGVTLLHTGEPARAEPLLSASLQEGLASCPIFARLAEAAAAQGHADDAARRRQQLDACVRAATRR